MSSQAKNKFFSKMSHTTSGTPFLFKSCGTSDPSCMHGKEALAILGACTIDPPGTSRCRISLTPKKVMLGTHFSMTMFAKYMHKYGNHLIVPLQLRITHRQPSGRLSVQNNPIGALPYKLENGKACHLPLELSTKPTGPLKHANMIARILKPLVLAVFVLRSQELHILSFIWESDIQILSTNVPRVPIQYQWGVKSLLLKPQGLGCAETKVATWDDLAFKLILLSIERET
ncbi:hypothetical protein Tco_0745333 [Tanacetum coccineum]